MLAEEPQGIPKEYVSHPSQRKEKVPLSCTPGGKLPIRPSGSVFDALVAAAF